MAANSSGCDITSTEKIAECMKVLGKEALLTIAEVILNTYITTNPNTIKCAPCTFFGKKKMLVIGFFGFV